MPMIDLHVPADSLDGAAAASLLDELATTLLRWEGAPDTEFFRSITWTYLHRETGLAVGGRPGGGPRYRVEVTVPAGALSERRKKGLIADVHNAVASAAGLASADALTVWTLIREVPEGNWGAAGEAVHFEQLLQLSATERKAQTHA